MYSLVKGRFLRSVPLRKFFIIIAFIGIAAVAAVAQEADSPKIPAAAEIYLAKDDGTGKAGAEADAFVPTDVPIYCVVQLDSNVPVTVKMNLVAVNVAGVRAETKVVSTTYTTKDLQNRVNFTGKPYGSWVVGKYRADIFVDGVLVGSKDFIVRKVAAPNEAMKPIAKPKAPVKVRLAKRT